MDAFWTWLQVHLLTYLTPPKPIEVIDIIQVLLIAWAIYRIFVWIKDSRAYTLLKGLLFVVIFVAVANLFNMEVIVWLLGNLSVAAITAIVIIFQPELRKALEQVGHNIIVQSLMAIGRSGDENFRFSDRTLNEIVRACYEMGEVKTGALIVIERDVTLGEYEKTGIPVDALVTGQLLINIFEKNTPLHDGAVIVRNDRVAAATCYLPLSENMELSKKLGTRHRAGLGISEISDSFTIIVSEETGAVSYAAKGSLHAAVSPSKLREQLKEIQKRFPDPKIIKGRKGKRGEKTA